MLISKWTQTSNQLRRLFIYVTILAVLAAQLLPARAAYAADDFAVPSGHFFTQTGDRPGVGFEVSDGERDSSGRAIRFWTEFQRLGGVSILGYPVSRVYRDSDGYYYQLFQRALLQWRPENGSAVLANLMDQLTASGADAWLSTIGVPPSRVDDGSNGDFSIAVRTRLDWLIEPHIRDAFLGSASTEGDLWQAIERYGLPTSLPVRSGAFIVQRFQRIALQVWLDNVPGMPAPGTVVPILAGDLYRQDGMRRGGGILDGRFLPEGTGEGVAPVAGQPGSTVDPGLRIPLDLLVANPEGSRVAAALQTPGVKLIFENVPAIAIFSGVQRTVAVNPDWRNSDPKSLAAVLAHEGSHLNDFLTGVEMDSTAGCYRTEFTAFATQAKVWSGFYGPEGKPNPQNQLERDLNEILRQVTHNPQGFAAQLATLYRVECHG